MAAIIARPPGQGKISCHNPSWVSPHNHLPIITNSLRVAHILYKNPRFEVMVPGGTLRSHNGGIIGAAATAFVSGFRADYLVTSVGAIESEGALHR